MTLQQLRYLIAIANHGSISAAAHTLYVSQSSLSVAVRDIERETGVTIFERSNRGITLTSDGIELLGYARQVVEQADLMEQRYSGRGGEAAQRLSITSQHYAFEQGANNSFFYSEEPLAELPHTKCISVSDRGTLSNLLAHHNGYTISTGVLSSEMYTGIASVPLQTKELMRVGYIVHNERQLSPLAQSYIEKLSLFVEGYQIGLAGL